MASGLKSISRRPKSTFDGLLAGDLRHSDPRCPCPAPALRTLRREPAIPLPGGGHPNRAHAGHRERRPVRSERHMAWTVDGRRWDNHSHVVCTALPGATFRRSSSVRPRKRSVTIAFQLPAAGATVDKPTAVASTKALTGRMLKTDPRSHTAIPPSEDGFLRMQHGAGGVAFRGLSCTRVRASIRPVLP